MSLPALVNGVATDTIPISDRAVLYGDSLFETVAIDNGLPLLLLAHLQRLSQSAARLGIDCDIEALKADIQTICTGLTGRHVARITLTRGSGSRGYQPTRNETACRIVSLHEWPDYPQSMRDSGIRLGLSEVRLAKQPFLAGIKHGNRLEQVLAAATTPNGCDDVVMLDSDGNVISTSKANIFVLRKKSWLTPALDDCGINGLIRQKICASTKSHRTRINVQPVTLNDLEQADAVFVSNCIIGLWPVWRFMDIMYPSSVANCQPMLQFLLKEKCCL